MRPTLTARRASVPLDDDAPIPFPRRTLDWGKIVGLACMAASAMVIGFLMQIMWRLAVLDHLALKPAPRGSISGQGKVKW